MGNKKMVEMEKKQKIHTAVTVAVVYKGKTTDRNGDTARKSSQSRRNGNIRFSFGRDTKKKLFFFLRKNIFNPPLESRAWIFEPTNMPSGNATITLWLGTTIRVCRTNNTAGQKKQNNKDKNATRLWPGRLPQICNGCSLQSTANANPLCSRARQPTAVSLANHSIEHQWRIANWEHTTLIPTTWNKTEIVRAEFFFSSVFFLSFFF